MSMDDRIEEVLTACELPSGGEQPEFEAPWQARAFGLAVVLTEQGHITWNDFQHRFATRLDGRTHELTEAEYYRHWISALEETVTEEMASSTELAERVAEFERGDRDASEFVAGVTHNHDHTHDHDRSHNH